MILTLHLFLMRRRIQQGLMVYLCGDDSNAADRDNIKAIVLASRDAAGALPCLLVTAPSDQRQRRASQQAVPARGTMVCLLRLK